uniref:Uncharacterized protein n=1 Tax=Panagrolaimus sp. JU765 TaxID=591449 RepID=A0AC34RDL7_9BILA
MRIRSHVAFNFGKDFMVYQGSEALLRKLIQFAVPYVKRLEFSDSEDKWYDVVFNILSKESNQKYLLIHGLPAVNDKVRTALTNMVDKGVLIGFKKIKTIVVFELPPCNFQCLTVEPDPESEWRFLKYIKCSFRTFYFPITEFCFIDENLGLSWRIPDVFIVDYVQEIYSAHIPHYYCKMEIFNFLKRIFPNANTLFIDLDPNCKTLIEYYENDTAEIKEAISQAPQENIHILWQIYPVEDEKKLITAFDGKKIGDNTFEWKMDSNEKKTIKLQFLEKPLGH